MALICSAYRLMPWLIAWISEGAAVIFVSKFSAASRLMYSRTLHHPFPASPAVYSILLIQYRCHGAPVTSCTPTSTLSGTRI